MIHARLDRQALACFEHDIGSDHGFSSAEDSAVRLQLWCAVRIMIEPAVLQGVPVAVTMIVAVVARL